MVTAAQWAGGIILGLIALVTFVLFGAAVLAAMEQPSIPTVVVGALIAFALLCVVIATSVGAWGLIMSAMGS